MKTRSTLCALLLLSLSIAALGAGERMRNPVFAGSWYPGDEAELRKAVRGYIEKSSCEVPPGDVIGLICPHAGYLYSGAVAGQSYRVVRGKHYDVVVLIGPSHRYPFSGASVYSSGVWKTPLGDLSVDGKVADSILEYDDSIMDIEKAHSQEHSLELQLPFVREALGDVPIVPIVMADRDYESARVLASAIVRAVGDKHALLIASSDLSHYHSGKVADRLDNLLIERVRALDARGLLEGVRSGTCEACGAGPIATILLASKELGARGAYILSHANSGDVTGDYDRVVGYLAAAITTEKPVAHSTEASSDSPIGAEDRAFLRKVVRETINAAVDGRAPDYESGGSPVLREERGAFVTLKLEGRLRGCMGQIVPTGTLLEVVKAMAYAAAFRDPRFKPLSKQEAGRVEIEISVLTPLTEIDDVNRIEVGKHGIYLKKGYRTGVLLPQVPVEQGWNREEFLEGICRKANLPGGCWDDPSVQLSIFGAQVF